MILALPLYDDNPIRRSPVVTWGLIGMCIDAFLWQLGQDDEIVAVEFGMVPARLFNHASLAPQLAIVPAWATLFTSMFLPLRPRRIMLLQLQRMPIWAAVPPTAMLGRRTTFHRGSVPDAGPRFGGPPSPWR